MPSGDDAPIDRRRVVDIERLVPLGTAARSPVCRLAVAAARFFLLLLVAGGALPCDSPVCALSASANASMEVVSRWLLARATYYPRAYAAVPTPRLAGWPAIPQNQGVVVVTRKEGGGRLFGFDYVQEVSSLRGGEEERAHP